MTAPLAVFAATAAVVTMGIALACVGVALVAGLGWSLIVGGAALAATAVGGGFVLLRDDGLAG